MADRQTLDFYDGEAPAYADQAASQTSLTTLDDFANLLPAGADVLDFGCGSGWAAARFREMGFSVTGFDGSEGLAAEARARHGLDVTVGTFQEFSAIAAHDGIWASFCLLHDTREAMPSTLGRLHAALRPSGVLYLGLKVGSGTARDRFGRRYTYFGEDEIRDLLREAGFDVLQLTTETNRGYDGVEGLSMHVFARNG